MSTPSFRGPRPVSRIVGLLALLAGLSACQTTGTGDGARAVGVSIPPLSISSPADLMGRDGTALMAALGEPALLRKEVPAQVWQYRGASCVLDFFLYEEDGQARVTHIESRGRTGGPASADQCLRDVHRARYVTPRDASSVGA